MNYIELGILAFMGLALFFGLIFGLARGSRRSALRLLLILLCIVAAFMFKSKVTNSIFAADISSIDSELQSMTVEDYVKEMLAEQLPEQMQSLTDSLILPLVKSLVSVVVFLLLFVGFRFISWLIVYPICKIFVKPKRVTKENGKVKRKKHPFIGGGVGLVQGVLIALCICVPLVGLVIQTNSVINAANKIMATQQTAYTQSGEAVLASTDGAEGADEADADESQSDSANSLEQIIPAEIQQMISDFTETNVAKFFGEKCKSMFDAVSKIEVEYTDDSGNVVKKEVVLSEQIGAIEKIADVAAVVTQDPQRISTITEQVSAISTSEDPVQSLKDLTSEDSELRKMLQELDAATGDLTAEQAETINNVISSVVDAIDIQSDNEQTAAVVESFKEALKETDLSTVEFEAELDIVDKLVEIVSPSEDENGETQELTQEEISAAINEAAQSTLILPILETVIEDGTELNVNLSDETKEQVEQALEELPEDTDQETINTIKLLLGLSSEQTEQSAEDETAE